MQWGSALLLLACSGVAPLPARAHPHVFVDYGVVLLFGPEGMTGLEFTWTYDDLFSSLILESARVAPSRTLSAAASQAIEQRHFQPLRAGHYFLDIRVDGSPVRVDAVRDFRASLSEDRLRYTFIVPITAKNPREGTVEIRVDDPTYYVAFDPQGQSPVRWNAPPTYAVSCLVIPGSGSFDSATTQCRYRRKSP